MDLLSAWRDWKPDSPPYLLPGDKIPSARCADVSSWETLISHRDFGLPRDARFHLGLLPIPFIGDLKKAKVVFLLLNPGLDPADYFGEFEVDGFRRRLVNNLQQEFSEGTYPFFYLDPAISWHSGYRYWHGKFQGIIRQLADEKWRVSYARARRCFAGLVACVQLVPYISFRYHLSESDRKSLESTRLALEYVRTELYRGSRLGEVLIIVTRKTKVWDLKPSDHVIVYSNPEARAAHLTSHTSMRIKEFLGNLGPDRVPSSA